VTPSPSRIASPPFTGKHRSFGTFSASAWKHVVFEPMIRAPVRVDHVAVSNE
jgi:hypothetical protein